MSVAGYGQLELRGTEWVLTCEPHVAMMAKRLFHKIPSAAMGELRLPATPEMSRDLQWFVQRYPLTVRDWWVLDRLANAHADRIARLSDLIDPSYKPQQYTLAVPPRDYQRVAADWWLNVREGLLADDLGLGKTCSAICGMVSGKPLPCLVVCMTHLCRQWRAEINRFAPDLHVHIVRRGAPYAFPKKKGRGPDVLICTYSKLAGQGQVLGSYCKGVVFDECQELRRSQSLKYQAASHVANSVDYRMGLSATPIFNFGGEMWNVMNVLTPGRLGTWNEFATEWIKFQSQWGPSKSPLKDPEAFGSWLRSQFLMLRRTRREVGRELDRLTRITHEIDSDRAELDKIEDAAGELARIILDHSGSRKGIEKASAAEEFSMLLRQATGIAKAPSVAAFVRMLVESGEQVVLYGWHHAVYEIWRSKLKEFRPAFYTGRESAAQKEESKRRFIERETPVIVLSLRAGAGLDGLQKVSRVAVFGELDWSGAVHDQCIGRVLRDGQADAVTAYFLTCEDGSDPVMCDMLGLKNDQLNGVRADKERELEQRVDSVAAVRSLAEQFLSRKARR